MRVNQNFKFCYDYIKNNSNINLDYKVTLELSDPAAIREKHAMSYIFH